MRLGLLGMGPVPEPYRMADFLQGRPYASNAISFQPALTYAFDRLIEGIGQLTKSNYDHALALITA